MLTLPDDLAAHEPLYLYVHNIARFTGSGLVDGLNVVPHGSHEIARFMGGAVVGFHNPSSPSGVACMLLDPLCPTSLHWLASPLPVTSSAILSTIKATSVLTTLPLSSPSLYVTALGLRVRHTITSTRQLDGNLKNLGRSQDICFSADRQRKTTNDNIRRCTREHVRRCQPR